MPIITELQLHHRLKDGDLEIEIMPPSAQDTGSIKLDVGRMVEDIRKRGKSEYWYLVVKVRKADGSDGYRTMIPKTLL